MKTSDSFANRKFLVTAPRQDKAIRRLAFRPYGLSRINKSADYEDYVNFFPQLLTTGETPEVGAAVGKGDQIRLFGKSYITSRV
jgi:hypothetical protein